MWDTKQQFTLSRLRERERGEREKNTREGDEMNERDISYLYSMYEIGIKLLVCFTYPLSLVFFHTRSVYIHVCYTAKDF